MADFPAAKLTLMALRWLRGEYPDALLTTELCTEKYAGARLDVGAITEQDIMGVEVKGDGETAARLNRQGWVYSRSASKMWLLAAPSLRDRIGKHKPPGWNELFPSDDGLTCPYVQPQRLANAPAALLDILWKDELLIVSGELGVPCMRTWFVHDIAEKVAEEAPLGALRDAVCRALLRRDWHKRLGKTVWRGGDEFPEPPAPMQTRQP